MKKMMLIAFLKKMKAKPALWRKVKVFAVIGLVGFLVTGAFAIWAGISAVSYVVDKANTAMHSPAAATYVENLKTEVKGLKLQPLSCWGKTQSLMAVEPWLVRPVWDNLRNLQQACLEGTTTSCAGQDCASIDDFIPKVEGEKI